MRRKNEKQTSGSARYSTLFRSSLVTFSSLRSRLPESALFFHCRVFSLRLTWKKTPRTSSSSQSGYKRAKKVEVSCVCVLKSRQIVTCFDLFTVKGKKRKAENMQEEEEEEKGPAPAEEEQAQTSQQAADDSDSDSDDSSDDEK